MNRRTARSGFSLPEVLVAVVLLGVIGGALTKLVVSQMRFFDNVSTTRSARSVARNAMNVMMAELRMVQAENGVSGATTTTLTVTVPYAFGIFCGSAGVISTASMMPVDSVMQAMAQYAGYGYRTAAGTYTVVPSVVAPIASVTPARCTGSAAGEAEINTITINNRVGQILDIPVLPGATVVGTPIFLYQTVAYSFAASTLFPGKIGLFRTVNAGAPEELMGPFATTAGFRYYQTGEDVSSATVPTLANIRGVDVVLTAISARKPAGQTAESQSKMVTSVFFKNVATP